MKTLNQFTNEVNFLMKREVDIMNEEYKSGKSLFGAEYIPYPESMMEYYYEPRKIC